MINLIRRPIHRLLGALVLLLSMMALATLGSAESGGLKISPAREVTETNSDNLGRIPNGLGLSPGDAVADFNIKTFEGLDTSFNILLEDAPLLVIFYRGGWCPYCNFQIRDLTMGYAAFRERGVLPVLISVDRPVGASEVQKTYEIPFPVLSDPGLTALTEFNVRLEVSEEQRSRMSEFGIDLRDWSGAQHHVIAASSAFLIDQAGTVKWAHVSEDYRVRPTNQQLLGIIDSLRAEGEI